MPKALARPEQTSYPSPVAAGHDAAALWLEDPAMLLAAWHNYCFSMRVCGIGFNDLIECRQVFDEAFVQDAADAIAGVVIITVEVGHA